MKWGRLIAAVAAGFVSGCSITQIPVSERLVVDRNPSIVALQESVRIELSGAKDVLLRAGTSWTCFGSIEQGTVCSSADQLVVVESYNTRQAYIVVHDDQVVGYYLPVENSFVEVEPVKIHFADIRGD